MAPVPFLVARGPHIRDARVRGPAGCRLGVGDRCLHEVADDAMSAHVEATARGLEAYIYFREDGWGDLEWRGFEAVPNVIALLATPPLAWFLVEWSGAHARAPVTVNRSPRFGE